MPTTIKVRPLQGCLCFAVHGEALLFLHLHMLMSFLFVVLFTIFIEGNGLQHPEYYIGLVIHAFFFGSCLLGLIGVLNYSYMLFASTPLMALVTVLAKSSYLVIATIRHFSEASVPSYDMCIVLIYGVSIVLLVFEIYSVIVFWKMYFFLKNGAREIQLPKRKEPHKLEEF